MAESEVDQGLFESLMGMGMGTLRRNKKSRNSTKNRYENQTFEDICIVSGLLLHELILIVFRDSKKSGDLMRSRTRENNVYEEEE